MPAEKLGARRSERDDKSRLRWSHATAGLVATITVLLSGAIGAEPARAGTYVMRNCNVPGHGNSPMAPWQVLNDPKPNLSIADACAVGNGVAFALDGLRQLSPNQYQAIMLYRPTGPRRQITLVKATVWYAARLVGFGQPMMFYTHDRHTDGSMYQGLTTMPPGSENVVAEQQLTPTTSSVELGLWCVPANTAFTGESCASEHGVPLLIRGIEVTLSEDVPPVVVQPKGTLLEGGPQSGNRTLTYSAIDPQSGLSKVDVRLDDTVVASRDLTTECFYSDFTVCPDSSNETLQVDTRSVPNGPHRLTVRVQDAAGNERTVDGGHVVDVANVASPVAVTGPAFTIVAKFNGASRSTLTVPYGRRVSLRGRLAQGSGPVAAGTPIEVLERLDSKKPETSAERVETKADGSFSALLSTDRPSRTVRLAYLPTGGGGVFSQPLKLRVRSASRLRASLHGRMVHFSGLVLSGPIAKRGKRLLMEGRSPGSSWTQFMSLRTDRRGRFSGTYRLRVRRPGVLLKIRAVVPRENGYGYVSSRSRAVALRVR